MKVIVKQRQGETAWTWGDFSTEKSDAGWPPSKILARWKQWEDDTTIDREGSGDKMVLWVPDKKRRIRDVSKEITNRYTESSKQMKKTSLSAANDLKNFCHDSQASFSEAFFKEDALAAKPPGGDPSSSSSLVHPHTVEPTDKVEKDKDKGKKIELAIAVPDEYQAQTDSLDKLHRAMVETVKKGESALEKATSEKVSLWNVAGKALHRSCKVRHACGILWLATTGTEVESAEQSIQFVLAHRVANPTPCSVRSDLSSQTPDAKRHRNEEQPIQPKEPASSMAKTLAPEKVPSQDKDDDKGKDDDKDVAEGGEEQDKSKDSAGHSLAEAPRSPSVERMPLQVATGTPTKKSPGKSQSKLKWKSHPVISPVTESLRRACLADGSARIPVQDCEELWTHGDIQSWIEVTMDIEDLDMFADTKRHWKVMSDMATQLRQGIAKSANKLSSYSDRIDRAGAQSVKKEVATKERVLISEQKQMARAARVKLMEQSEGSSPLFQIPEDIFKSLGSTLEVIEDASKARGAVGVNKPMLLQLMDVTGQAWSLQAKMQLALTSFGGEYKSMKSTQNDKKGFRPLMAKEGKEETDKMFHKLATLIGFDALMPTADDLAQSPASAIVQHTWLYGYLPGGEFGGLTNQALPQLTVLAHGKIAFVMCQTSQLVQAWDCSKHGKLNTENLKDMLLAQDGVGIKKLTSAGCCFYVGLQKPAQALLCPTGWTLIERADSEAMLVYGVKKSFLIKGESPHQDYSAALALMEVSGKKKMDKYREVQKLIGSL